MRFASPGDEKEPIGERIINCRMTLPKRNCAIRIPVSLTIPSGSVASASAVNGGGKTVACSACHGCDAARRSAGHHRTATYIFRQLNDIQSGRDGTGVAFMKPAVANPTLGDMIAIAAFGVA